MSITVLPHKNNITFTSRTEDDDKNKKKVTQSEVATATGATGAAAASTKVKGNSFDMFKSSSKAGKLTKETAETLKTAKQPIKQANGLFSKFMQAFKNTKASWLKWADSVKNSSMIKPLVKSGAYKFLAGSAGAVMGIFVTITGIGDIANTVAEYVQK